MNSEEERAVRLRLMIDLPFYAEHCLKIRDKAKRLVPLVLNGPQLYAHEQIEAQLARTGKVRALVLKGRKQGISTYIGARSFHATSHRDGWEVGIIAHEASASDTLFQMAKRFYDHLPKEVAPTKGYSNAKELTFPKLDARYNVFTAGSKEVGRSKTPMMVHGSEVAFWKDLKNTLAGLIQAVPDTDGTEIVLESTANGFGGEFHEMWLAAEAGLSDWIAIFIPWFWSSEYRELAPDDFQMTDSEARYARLHGLDADQMYWRRGKIGTLGERLFKQEYPATAAEAFQSTGDSYIQPDGVLEARKATFEGIGPLILGVDPARSEAPGADRFAIIRRRGRKAYNLETRHGIDTVSAAGWVKSVIDAEKVERVFIDTGGLGVGVYDTLRAFGKKYEEIVIGVNFGSAPRDPIRKLPNGDAKPGPIDRRAEMWMDGKAWLEEESGAEIPDLDELQTDICAPGYTTDHKQRIRLESKEAMAKRGLRSPDTADALMLTFAAPVVKRNRTSDILKKLHAAERAAGTQGWQG